MTLADSTPSTPPDPDRPGLRTPEETPECEGSTSHGISVPEPVELRTAWPSWIPLLAIGLLVLSFVGFAVARVWGWGG
ncbi:hypothetical protein ACGFX4_15805 [Kitasatospora sp. NPDC048365]|uniref:hypothetical protein n=1 Tax=Kitasatospora sp. NPDC048365 TaxID=3364050 RepID=UPI003719E7AB